MVKNKIKGDYTVISHEAVELYEVRRRLEEPQVGSSLLKCPEAKTALTSDLLLDEVKQKQTQAKGSIFTH